MPSQRAEKLSDLINMFPEKATHDEIVALFAATLVIYNVPHEEGLKCLHYGAQVFLERKGEDGQK